MIRNQWARLWGTTLFWTVILIAALTFIACGKDGENQTVQDIVQDPTICGDGLGAIDLAGTCRRNPSTPGALEAV